MDDIFARLDALEGGAAGTPAATQEAPASGGAAAAPRPSRASHARHGAAPAPAATAAQNDLLDSARKDPNVNRALDVFGGLVTGTEQD
jgi:hypothetical protein